MNYMQTPFKIIINEVVNMAKKYGEDSSPAFVNGVLAKIVEENNKTTTAVNRKHRRQNIHLTQKSFKKRSIHPFQKTI